MEAPSIKSRMVPNPWVIAVVHMSAPAIPAIKPYAVVPVAIESSRIIRVPAAGHVGALHIAAMPSHVHDARSVVFTHNPAPTTDAVLNVHAAAVDRTHRPVRTDIRVSSTLQRYRSPRSSA